jgi:hypothetical protein
MMGKRVVGGIDWTRETLERIASIEGRLQIDQKMEFSTGRSRFLKVD